MSRPVYPGFTPLNKRRVELINKKGGGKLPDEEERELKMLQIVVDAMIAYAYPAPSIDEILCSDCKGIGEVIYMHWWAADETERFLVPCPKCEPKLLTKIASSGCTDCEGKGYVDPPKTKKRTACVCAVIKGKSLKDQQV